MRPNLRVDDFAKSFALEMADAHPILLQAKWSVTAGQLSGLQRQMLCCEIAIDIPGQRWYRNGVIVSNDPLRTVKEFVLLTNSALNNRYPIEAAV